MRIAAHDNVSDLILDAADRLLARYGYSKLTMEDLAREVGIGKGTIYLHFSSKEEVVLSHIDRIVERVKHQLETIARAKDTAAARLRKMLLARVLIRFDSVQHYTDSLADVLVAIRPGLLARRDQYFREEAGLLAQVLSEGAAKGELAIDDPREAADLLLLATNGLLPYNLSRRELGERADVEKRTARIADVLLKGLLSRDRSPIRRNHRLVTPREQ